MTGRVVDSPVLGAAGGKVHVEVEQSYENRWDWTPKAVCGCRISDAYRSRSGGLVTCRRCLRELAKGES